MAVALRLEMPSAGRPMASATVLAIWTMSAFLEALILIVSPVRGLRASAVNGGVRLEWQPPREMLRALTTAVAGLRADGVSRVHGRRPDGGEADMGHVDVDGGACVARP